MRILVVEDEPTLQTQLVQALNAAGYATDAASNGIDAHHLGASEPYDAVLLDLGLPQMDGLTVLKQWRSAGMRVPVLILTARDGWHEKVAGIDAGADDYLPKPFNPRELIARLGAILRRTQGHTTPLIEIGGLRLDTRGMTLTRNGRPVALTPLEYRALRYLAHNRGRVVSQFELCEHVWSGSQDPGSNTLEVLIARLRKKIGSEVIRTQRGHGYVIAA